VGRIDRRGRGCRLLALRLGRRGEQQRARDHRPVKDRPAGNPGALGKAGREGNSHVNVSACARGRLNDK
jgi:hypothetical protein